jgi:uncharacterized membrane protein HdeD (DUF308 family)
MIPLLSRNGWLFLLRGVAAILLGFLVIIKPGTVTDSLLDLFAIYVLTDGILSVAVIWTDHTEEPQRWLTLEGLISGEGLAGIICAVFIFMWPGSTAFSRLCLLSGWAILARTLEMLAVAYLREEILNEWCLALSGMVSIAFGAMIILNACTGALSLTDLIGVYGVVFGVLLSALSLQFHRLYVSRTNTERKNDRVSYQH